jgi:hypothetical protein
MPVIRILFQLAVLFGAVRTAEAAELFYLDHDALTGRYVGPTGPLVISGDIDAGDEERLLAKIEEDVERFLSRNAVVVASTDGDVDEAIKIAGLLRALDSDVTVEAATGRCAGPCFLIYAAAAERASGGPLQLGFSTPVPEAARAWLTRAELPRDLLDELARSPPGTMHWLTEAEEARVGGRSPAFARELAARCAWSDAAEREAIAGRRPFRELEPLWACRARVSREAARATLRRLRPPAGNALNNRISSRG